MLTVDELLHKSEAYQRNRMSLKEFEEWFEDNSIDTDGASEVNELRAAIDSALAEYHYDHIGEDIFRKELAAAILPFEESQTVVSSKPRIETRSTSRSVPLEGRNILWILRAFEQSKKVPVRSPDHRQIRIDGMYQIA